MANLTIDVNDLPARYAEAVARAEQGDEVIVTAAGQPTVRLVALPTVPVKREWAFNLHPGAMIMRDDFDAYIDEEDFLRGDT